MEELKCPKCGGGKIVKAGHDKGNVQRYQCKDCKHRFVLNPTVVFYEKHEKECPLCSFKYAKKAGKSGDKQYYKCIKCGHKFLEDGLYKSTTEKDKYRMIDFYRKGLTRPEISERTGYSIKTIFNVLKKAGEIDGSPRRPRGDVKERIIKSVLSGEDVLKVAKREKFAMSVIENMMQEYYRAEEVTEHQKQLLYKFGIECNVPVEYLAPYVHCSSNYCSNFLKENESKKYQKRNYILTDVQKAFDKMDLDRFIK